MVKRTFLLGAALIAVSACNPKAPDTTAKSADTTSMATTDSAGDANLRAAALKWFELYNKQDADGVAALYADDAVIMAPGASAAAGKEAIRTFLAGDIAGAKKAGVSDTAGQSVRSSSATKGVEAKPGDVFVVPPTGRSRSPRRSRPGSVPIS